MSWDPRVDYMQFEGRARAYAVRKWSSYNKLYFAPQDVASMALLTLCEVANDDRVDAGIPETWWGLLKLRIDSHIMSEKFKKWANDPDKVGTITVTWENDDGTIVDPAEVHTSLRVRDGDQLMLHDLADTIARVPRPLKIALALRFFEGHQLDSIAARMGATKRVPTRWVRGTCDHLLDQARRMVLAAPATTEVKVPTVDSDYAALLEESTETYVQKKYGVDVSSWLGWIQLAYRVDVSFILDMLDVANGHKLQVYTPRIDYSADVDHLDTLDPRPVSRADVQQRTGWGAPRSTAALSAWRRRHGIDAPMNGAAAKNQAIEFAA